MEVEIVKSQYLNRKGKPATVIKEKGNEVHRIFSRYSKMKILNPDKSSTDPQVYKYYYECLGTNCLCKATSLSPLLPDDNN